MPKITVMMDGAILNQIDLTKESTTLGRRPCNDIVLDHLTVSGEHAVLHLLGSGVSVQDLDSTNGTYLGGKAIKNEDLQHGDVLEIGKYRLKFEADPASEGTGAPVTAPGAAALSGLIKVLSGPAAGREMSLAKVVTTIGKPGISVAAITQRHNSFFVHQVQGSDRLTINGENVGENPCVLQHGDRIVLAGTEMQFLNA
ncbi:MAG: FHA domain-containing protein [Rhodoferax sp.]|nr:FHA domain-containing protein [Rhodoferax sp.]